jgi:hypothetical protein
MVLANALPLLTSCYYLIRRLYERRWRSLLFFLALWTVTSALLAIGLLIKDRMERTMIPEEHYVWTGWYTILLFGLVPTGGLLWLFWLQRGLFRAARGLYRTRWRPAPKSVG